MMAMAASIALHACVTAWLLSSAMTQVATTMPQQMIEVAFIAAPSTEAVEQEAAPTPPKPVPQSSPKEVHPALPKAKTKPAAQTTVSKTLSAPEPMTGPIASASNSAPMTVTQPLFDAAYLNNPAPDYPSHAKRRNMEGTVILEVSVSAEGTAQTVRIAESSGFSLLDESAKNAVSRWKFIPAKRGGESVEARVMVPIEFRLE
jgi:periplasmic protein TonB